MARPVPGDDSAPAQPARPGQAFESLAPPSESTPPSIAPATFVPPPDDQLTPAMRQYWQQKRQVPDALLLFRMGDFYELFYDDARVASRLLGIALTSRDRGQTPLAGIPHHALENYLARLVAAGQRVAISEQIEDAAQARGVVQRAIVRIVTAGTLTDEALLAQTQASYVAAVCLGAGTAGIASLELSSGQFAVRMCDPPALIDELCRLAPAEVLLAESDGSRGSSAGLPAGRHPLEADVRDRVEAAVCYRPAADFGSARALDLLERHFETRGLEGFGFSEMDASLQAAGALLAYVLETQKGAVRHLRPPRRLELSQYLVLDPTTLRSLEVERTLRTAAREGSLVWAVDRTCNPMGARRLREWLCYPLRDAAAIRRRQTMIGALRESRGPAGEIRAALREMSDLERMVGRVGVQRTHPRDLRGLGDGLAQLPRIRDALRGLHHGLADEFADQLEGLDALSAALCAALRPDAPAALKSGGIFADGHHPELDRLRIIARDGQRWLAEFQAREIQRSGIGSLKVAYNKVFGFYIEITHTHRDRVPADYVRKQTVKNAERYITDELKRYEADALSAEARAAELEYELFSALRELVAAQIPRLQQACAALAAIDVLAGWAEWSVKRRCCEPEFVDEPLLEIEEGRHPVVEQALEQGFVPSDTRLAARPDSHAGADSADASETSACLALITGPNMAGKSTYIRQVALLTLLAHCGAWVPARRMRLGICDRIFTRVGAADELARGQSTFMVEMLETSSILHNATQRSLVILDEVGRGTSTYDGLSLAWAISEHLASTIGCRALFATHYHELTELADLIDGVANFNVAVREYEEQVVFLHRIVPGSADRSYGLHVAKLAGVPRPVLERAAAVLMELEQAFGKQSQRPVLAAAQRRRQRQLRLFEAPEERIVRELRELKSALDPQAAAETLEKWRASLH